MLTTTLTRTDCTRDNKRVRLPLSCRGAYSVGYCKRGMWIHAKPSDDGFPVIGRAVGRVVCEGREYIEAVMLCSGVNVTLRWIEPRNVLACYRVPPRNVLRWLTSESWNARYVLSSLEYGVSDTDNREALHVELGLAR